MTDLPNGWVHWVAGAVCYPTLPVPVLPGFFRIDGLLKNILLAA
jgi:hypothetical protein